MECRLKYLATLSILFLAAPMVVSAAAPTLLPDRVEQAISARIAAGEYPAMVVAVVDRDRSHIYGFGKLDSGNVPNASTLFQIGSVTKTFTATLLAEAVNTKAVALDTPVTNLLPDFKLPSRNGKQITLGELATQFSGLPRLPGNLKPADDRDPYADYSSDRLKEFLGTYALPRDPGDKYEYSNLGFGLLGYALAQRAHVSYAAMLKSEILRPLGMSSSSATLDERLNSNWATGRDEQGKASKPWRFEALAGCGAINSTAADMLLYLEANMGRRKGALRDAMQLAQTPRRDVGGNARIGLAWMTRHDKDGDVVWHNGMTGGYASFIGFTANRQHGVVILTNAQRSVDDLGFATLLPDAPLAPVQKQTALAPVQLDAYVGQYQLAPGFILHVFRDKDQLQAQATGQGAFPIFPSAVDFFFAKVADIQIDFKRGTDGNVDSLVLHQSGHETLASKLGGKAVEKVSGHSPVPLAASTLQQYVGRFQLAPNAVFTITLDNDQLKAQLTGQSTFPVYPSAKDEFYYTVVDAQLSFERDAQGKVVALVLHQNGTNQRAARLP